jgi:hypothetical protein
MKRLISILVALSAWGIAIGQPSVRIAHGPYLQQVTDDGFTVVWTTTINAASWVEVAPDDGSHFYAAERPKYYDSHIGKRRIVRGRPTVTASCSRACSATKATSG